MIAVYAGPEAEMREVLAPILALEPEGGMVAEMPYAELQSAIDDPPGFRNYWSAEHLDRASPTRRSSAFCARADDMVVPSPSQHILFPWGGAVTARRRRLAAAAPRGDLGGPSARPLGRSGRRRAGDRLGAQHLSGT